MQNLDAWTAFFGWCSVINLVFYAVSILALLSMRDFVMTTNRKVFGVSEAEFANQTMSYVARYKLAIIVFNVVPYFALRLMAGS